MNSSNESGFYLLQLATKLNSELLQILLNIDEVAKVRNIEKQRGKKRRSNSRKNVCEPPGTIEEQTLPCCLKALKKTLL
jgi:hypothetical protein